MLLKNFENIDDYYLIYKKMWMCIMVKDTNILQEVCTYIKGSLICQTLVENIHL